MHAIVGKQKIDAALHSARLPARQTAGNDRRPFSFVAARFRGGDDRMRLERRRIVVDDRDRVGDDRRRDFDGRLRNRRWRDDRLRFRRSGRRWRRWRRRKFGEDVCAHESWRFDRELDTPHDIREHETRGDDVRSDRERKRLIEDALTALRERFRGDRFEHDG